MSELSRWASRVFLFVFAAFWGAVTLAGLLWRWWKIGADLWKTKPHSKPKVLEGWQEDYVELENNIRLHYVWAGDKSRPLLLLAHGFPEFWYSWRFQIRFFEKFFYVVAVDLRGYNQSSKPSAISEYKTLALAKDLRDTIRALGLHQSFSLKRLAGKEKAFVMGHDWGAAVSWRLAMAFPEVVEKLVILNVPHPAAFKKILYNDYKQLLKSWYIFLFQLPFLPEFTVRAQDFKMIEACFRGKKTGIQNRENFTDDDLEAWKYVFSQDRALTGPINFYRAALQFQEKIENPIVKPETLIIWGTADGFLEKEGASLSTSYCEKGRVEFIDGASHWVQQDEPDRVNALVNAFLSS